MTAFDFKNAYRLAVQTNRELHMTLDSYKVMYEQAQKDLKAAQAEITRLRDELRQERMRNAGVE